MLKPIGLTKAAAMLVVAGLATAGAPSLGRAAPPEKPQNQPQDRAATVIDPAAVAALSQMGAYLSSLKSFELTADTTMEAVLRKGHQVEIGGVVHYWVKRPDRLRIDSETDMVKRQYFYDGKSFTIVAPLEGYFAAEEAKPTIRETLAFAAQRLDIELPFADLFDWGTPETPLKRFNRGFFVGTAKIGGVETAHYALIGKDLDFEVWIEAGDKPLPLKMAIVDRTAPGNPRFSARLSWKPDAQIADDVFTFTPSEGVKRISITKPEQTQKGGK